MKEVEKIQIQGVQSKLQVELDLPVLVSVFDWYVKYSPVEKRSLEVFIKVAEMYKALEELKKAEVSKIVSDIEDKLDGQIDSLYGLPEGEDE